MVVRGGCNAGSALVVSIGAVVHSPVSGFNVVLYYRCTHLTHAAGGALADRATTTSVRLCSGAMEKYRVCTCHARYHRSTGRMVRFDALSLARATAPADAGANRRGRGSGRKAYDRALTSSRHAFRYGSADLPTGRFVFLLATAYSA